MNPRTSERQLSPLILIYLLALVSALLFVACTPAGPGEAPGAATPGAQATTTPDTEPGSAEAGQPLPGLAALGQNEWWLAELHGESVEPTVVEPPVGLRFYEEGEVGPPVNFEARTFCNSLGGSARFDVAPVFDVEGETNFDCAETFSAQDQALIAALKEASGVRLADGRLLILDEVGEPLLAYEPKPEAELDPALAGTEWRLRDLQDAAPLADARPTLSFEQGTAGGNAGCNSYGAEIRTVAGGRFEIAGGGMTEMACAEPEGIMAQEQAYADAFYAQATAYRLEGDTLTLLDAGGEPVLVYERKVEQASDPAALVGNGWQLVQHEGAPVAADRPITLAFTENRYWGQSACRVYVGTYRATADDISFPSASMLGEPCADEQLFLPPNGDYVLADGRLALTGARGEAFVYEPLPAAGAQPLAGPEWQLLAFVGPGDTPADVQEPARGVTITARFDGEGRIAGSAGCNDYGAAYVVEGETLSLEEAEVTEALCTEPPDVMEAEARFLSWLAEATGYAIYGDLLLVKVAGGRLLLFTL